MTRHDWSRLAIFSALGLALSSSFLLLAGPPIRYLRLVFGRRIFFMSSITCLTFMAVFGLWPWAVPYAFICLLVGSYGEMEERGSSIFLASLLALMISSGLGFFGLFAYSQYKGLGLSLFIQQKVEPFVQLVQQNPQYQEISLQTFLEYWSSAMVVTMMMILFFSLTMTRRLLSESQQMEFKMFRLPDWFIWLFIGALGLSNIPVGLELVPVVAKNLLMIFSGAYFFQGLAVFSHFLDRLGIFGFWRWPIYFLITFQLFIFIIGLGILDYWLGFRLQASIKPNRENLEKTKRSAK